MPIDASTILFYLIALLACFAWYAVLAWRRMPRSLRFPDAPEGPRCQGCGYIFYRDGSTRCPECGADLMASAETRAGAARPTLPVPSTPVIVAAAIVLFPLTVALGYPIAARVPSVWEGEANHHVQTAVGDWYVWAYVRGRGERQRVSGTELVVPGGNGLRGSVNLNTMSFTWRRRGDRRTVPLTVEGLAGPVAGRGHDPDAPATREALARVVAELTALRENRWPEERFAYRMRGDQFIDPDDLLGPFFWTPSWVGWCLPAWVAATAWVAQALRRRDRERLAEYERQRDAFEARIVVA